LVVIQLSVTGSAESWVSAWVIAAASVLLGGVLAMTEDVPSTIPKASEAASRLRVVRVISDVSCGLVGPVSMQRRVQHVAAA